MSKSTWTSLWDVPISSECNVNAFVFQGRGSYEDRTEMLRLIVDLVEASIYADNPEWRLSLLKVHYLNYFQHLFINSMIVNVATFCCLHFFTSFVLLKFVCIIFQCR
jgi:hypothetical protein